jgi:hypothetical protein
MLLPVANTSTLYAVWGTDATHIWAVGAKNVGLAQWHGVATTWNGTTWSAGVEVMGSGGNPVFGLSSVWGSSATDLWSVGNLNRVGPGEISRGDGSTWATGSDLGDPLHGIFGTSTNDVWAISNTGAWHWNGGLWSGPTLSSGMGAQYGVWASASNDVWVVGDDNNATLSGMIAHWDGSGTWKTQTLTGARQLFAVWGSASNDVWAAGLSADQNSGIVSHYDGNSWSAAIAVPGTSGLNAVWNSGPKDIWVAGNCGTVGCMVHGDGKGWSPPMSVTDSTLFTGLWGITR